jgi:hypothetical protein
VPANAALYVTVDTDLASAQCQALQRLADKFPDKQHAVDSLQQALAGKGLDWERDVKPALGPELDVALLDLKHPNDSVALMQPKSKDAFEQAVAKGNAKDPKSQLVYEHYHGWTVVADKQSALDAFIEASEAAKQTLSDNSTFRSAMDKAGDGLVRAYVNGSRVMSVARNMFGADGQKYVQQFGTLDWLTTSLKAKSDGIAWDTVVHGTPGKKFEQAGVQGSDGSLQKFVPSDALVYLAFRGAKGMTRGLADNPILLQPGFEGLGRVFAELGTILEGENAFYIRPGAKYPEVTFIAAPRGGVDGAAVLDRVLGRLAKQLGARPKQVKMAGLAARAVGTKPVTVLYANVDGKLVVTDFPAGLRFVKSGGRAIAQSPEFRQAAKSSGLPAKPAVVLYVDIHSTLPVLNRLGAGLPEGVARNLKPLRSAVEYAARRSHELQISFFLRIE